jgi:ribose 5-phosphate isomerase A
MPDPSAGKKRRAAGHAAALVEPGIVLGLGTGSTAAVVVAKIGDRIGDGSLHDLRAVATSRETARRARRLGIPVTTLNRAPVVDLTIDGADEVDPDMNLIKGAGGALFREKIVAEASSRLVIVVDDTKCVDRLGSRGPLPVEVVPFARESVRRKLRALGAKVSDRTGPDGRPFLTDGGNRIFDADFGPIRTPRRLAARLDGIAGIAAHGLFLDLADEVIVASDTGVDHRMRKMQERT